ncbi:MAG: hypothetical protein U0572_13840 [Phycisphaerales bacterium]
MRHATHIATAIIVLTIATCTGVAFCGDPCEPHWSGALGTPGFTGGYVGWIAEHDDGHGSGVQLYATGSFTTAGGNPNTARIARWNGANWESVGGGLQAQFSNVLGSFGGKLYVGGYFDSAGNVAGTAKIARWNGATWESINAQLSSFLSAVWALAVYDDGGGPALYIGGNYLNIGGAGIDHIAKFDGTNFFPVGGTIVGPNQIILDLKVYNGELYACGRFQSIAGLATNNIARWDGTQWHEVGAGGVTGTQVICMEVVDGELYVGGSFTAAGGVPATRIARWDGTTWHALGAGLNSTVQDIVGYDEGNGPAVYVVGNFTATADGATTLGKIARWDGASWSPVGTGVGADGNVFESYVWDNGSGPQLLVGGSINSVNGVVSHGIAAWVGCPTESGSPDLDGDGAVDASDLGILLGSWGACPTPPAACVADLDGNGAVDAADLAILLGAWG